MPKRNISLAIRAGELLCYAAGAVATVFFVAQLAQGEVQRRDDIAEFEQAQSAQPSPRVDALELAAPQNPKPQLQVLSASDAPDTSLWAPGRILDYQASLAAELPTVLGVLEVPSVGLKVPVYPLDTELNMDRGAGVIGGMSYPHEGGNIGIAGHRDGYFRALKDVKVGDSLMLETLDGPKRFIVDATRIVEITDKALLKDTEEQTVTLVTCYPFYFVGHAPQRFIVTASLDITNVNLQ